jgi:hypothetical protein
MPTYQLVPIDHPSVAPLTISERLRSQIVYFASGPGDPGVPSLGEDEYFLARADLEPILDEGVLRLVSPLDTANTTEVELSEEQEALLEWLKRFQIQHVRVVTGKKNEPGRRE